MIQTLFGSVEQEPSLLEKLKSGVQKTRAGLVTALEDALQGKKEIDAGLLDELESTLISADIGVRTTTEILESIRQSVDRHINTRTPEHLLEILQASDRAPARVAEPPAVVLVVGVNGSGKTTTIGKLASRFKHEQRSVLLCAADTFRAAAIEQLEIWGQRTDTQVIRQNAGSDPSAVLFDAVSAAKARKVDYVIVDTAGRLQTKENLMLELQKMSRTARKVIPGAPHEVLLVLDATTGQNGLEQARKFTESSGAPDGAHRQGAESAHSLHRRRRKGGRPAALRLRKIHRIALRKMTSPYMRQALDLARKGRSLASPNPLVGAVLVREGEVVGRGFHTYAGLHHAEIIAPFQAGDKARGATLYLNLEPCSHHGRTPPCVDALIQAGVARVVAPVTDPNPLVAGQ